MNFIKWCVFVLVFCGLVACAKPSSVGESSPSWVDRPYDEVTQKEYLAAVGEADDLNTASDRAMASIGKIFEVKIDERSSDFTQVNQISSSSQGNKQTRYQGVSRFVGADTQQVLEGVSILETWKSETGRHYALAVLQKSLAEKLLKEELQQAESSAAAFMKSASQGKDIVSIMANLDQAKYALLETNTIRKQLTIIGVQPSNANISIDDVYKAMAVATGNTRIHVGATENWVKKLVESGASANGLNVVSSGGAKMDVTLVMDDVMKKEGWYWQKGVIKLALLQSDVILSEKIWPVKITSIERGGILPRFQQEVGKNINAYIYEVLTQIREK